MKTAKRTLNAISKACECAFAFTLVFGGASLLAACCLVSSRGFAESSALLLTAAVALKLAGIMHSARTELDRASWQLRVHDISLTN